MRRLRCILKQKCAVKSNETGFTLIEVLLALSMLSIIVFFMGPIFQIILQNQASQKALQAMEWEVFCMQIKKEIRLSSKAEVVSGRLILTKDGETVYYEKYGSYLRRRVNSLGHEILIQNVSNYSFTKMPNRILVTVTDLKGKNYSVTAYSLVDWGDGL
ncbi:competence type IV pilus minor pilin ComGF [Neobacillus niacini]|uniref:competence type IV pilus minor pilin ComGF n=1 Tax=Neobacillus niacini TaxID=86668 RepID=UPI0021CB1B53|nr:competence type IV pilus minor pilin ComGF [Neobacillus niacini]MCM3765263.1 prepilin-type N-terminal cleavage/methylation domain-containing protein [Neobacillus niacini]